MAHSPPKTDDPFDPASNPELVARPPGLPATEAEEQQATLFEQSLVGGLASARLQNLPPPAEDVEEPEDIPVMDSLRAGFESSGIAVAGAQLLFGEDLPELQSTDHTVEDMETIRPDLFKALKPGLDDPDSIFGAPRLNILRSFTSFADADRQLLRLQEAERRIEVMQANGTLTALAGSLGGISIDILAMVLIGMASGGTSIPISAGTIGVRSAQMARLLSAGRIGIAGATEGFVERSLQAKLDPTVTIDEILLATGLGGTIGGLLGGIFPKLGRVGVTADARVQKMLDDAEAAVIQKGPNGDDLVDSARATTGREAGAAVPADEVRTPGRGQGSLAARFAGPRKLQEWVLRNPKRIAADIGSRWRTFVKQDPRVQGGKVFFDNFARFVRVSTVFEEEIAGGLARRTSAQDQADLFTMAKVARDQKVKDAYKALREDLGVTGPIGAARSVLVNMDIDVIANKLGKGLITENEFEEISDLISAANDLLAKSDDPVLGAGLLGIEEASGVHVVPASVRSRFNTEQLDKIIQHAKKNAVREDAFYRALAEEELTQGVLDPNEIIRFYRPQRWNRDAIEDDARGFRQFIFRILQKEPDEDWLRKTTVEEVLGEGDATTVTSKPLLGEDETFDSVLKSDPPRAKDMIDLWQTSIRSQLQKERDAALDEVDRVRREALKKTETETVAKLKKRAATAEKSLRRLNTEFNKAKSAGREEALPALDKKIQRAERKLERNGQALREIDQAQGDLDQLDAILGKGRAVPKAQKAVLRRLAKSVTKAENASVKVAKAPLLSEQVDGIMKSILGKNSKESTPDLFGFADEAFIGTSSRFKRRSLNLGEQRFTPESRKYLLTNAHDNRAAYSATVGKQLALRKVFGDILGDVGKAPIDPNVLKAAFLKGFDNDLDLPNLNPKLAGKIKKDRAQAERLFDKLMSEFTHGDLATMHKNWGTLQDVDQLVRTWTAASALGHVVLAQVGDLMVMMAAGGRMGTGFNYLWRNGPRTKKIFKAIRDLDEDEIAVALQGPSTLDGSMWKARGDIDFDELDLAGGKMRSMIRFSRSVMHAEGLLSWMHVWNRTVRGGFGLDFAMAMNKDMGAYAGLPKPLKTFYAKIGITADEAADMHALMAKSHKRVVNGKLMIPDSAAWAKTRPDLLRKYKVAIKAAGDEAMLDPSTFDRPFLRSVPILSLPLQFSSFMFTAGERLVAPMIQKLFIHPGDMTTYAAILMGINMGIFVDALKSTARGPESFDRWVNKWDSPEGFSDNMWSGVLRGPMMAGMSALLLETLMTQYGGALNEATGLPITGTSPTRFRIEKGFGNLAGAAVGRIDRGLSISRDFVNGDVERALQKSRSMIPFINTLPVSILSYAYEEFT